MREYKNDIKAPDGYLLGGVRRVRKDGTILFQRGWWELPNDVKARFVGEEVWVHEFHPIGDRGGDVLLEVAAPGFHIYEARGFKPKLTVLAARNDRPDAASVFRKPVNKEWANRAALASKTPVQVEPVAWRGDLGASR